MKTTYTKHVTDLFRPLRKGDRATCAYIYTDGHAVVAFERRDTDTDVRSAYYKQIDNLGISVRFQGRVLFSGIGGGLTLLRVALKAGCNAISAHAPSLDGGTPATKEKGILVGDVCLETSLGTIYDYDFPGFMSAGTHYDPDVAEIFNPTADGYGIGGTRMAETLITADRANGVA